MASDSPPASWPQRVRRGLAFPPGHGADHFDVIVARDGRTYQLNLATREVYVQAGERWDQPPWSELPELVREAIWSVT